MADKPMPCVLELLDGTKIEVKPIPLSAMPEKFQKEWERGAIKSGWILGPQEPCEDCENCK